MANLKEVRNRISSVKSTQQITRAMKMVAAAKLRKAQERITQMRPYAERLNGILQNLSASISDADEESSSEFTQDREPEKVLIVVITSDRGLCGAFNNNVIKAALNLAKEKYADQLSAGQVSFMGIGKKGFEAFKKSGFIAQGEYVNIFKNLSFEAAKEAGEYILNQFSAGEIDRVELVFNEFKNVVVQIVRTNQFLPILPPEEESEEASASNVDYLLEPSRQEIIEELIPKSLKIQFYRAVLESNAGEHGARMTAMDNATENAEELLKNLKLTYNQTRQAAITKEILEIVGGAEALKAQ